MQLPSLQITDVLARALEGAGAAVDLVGPWGSAKTLTGLQTAERLGRPALFITPGRIESEGLHEDLCTFTGPERAFLFPAWETLPTDAMEPADDIVAERLSTLQALAAALSAHPTAHVVAPVRSLLQRVVEPERLAQNTLSLRCRAEYDLEHLIERLSAMGYERELMVERRGQMSVRGGILDLFPAAADLPYRIEFFGDEVDSIRVFEPETQRSVRSVDEAVIGPRSEKRLLVSDATSKAATLLDYLPSDTLIVIDEPAAVDEEAAAAERALAHSPYALAWNALRERMAAQRRLYIAQVPHAPIAGVPRMTTTVRSVTGWQGQTERFWAELAQWQQDDFTVAIYCNNSGERQRLLELLEEQGYRPGPDRFPQHVDVGALRAGFVSSDDRLAAFSEREIFGRHYVRRARRRFEAGEAITAFGDLRSGDYVVHAVHGIGRYLGLKRFSGKSGDFLALQYSGGDTLYVPVAHIDMVQKYSSGEGALPKIDRIGGATWAKTRARVKKAVKDMAEDLLRLYAARQSREGHAFMPDTPWQREFEDAFEYDETPDQLRAIQEVKRDMESERPMDRLICGDVGFGKTEVALRAAFKAVMDGKQVAVLAPTTVLAEQHYLTFSERMADFPVRIAMLSRFRTPKEIKEAIEKASVGEVDIVVGTHRLTSKDIHFHNLGLVIIDEEQRFGVAQKERLKQLRTLVDVLTLSATPIPRTLNLSLMGVRDLSLINTAPNDRLPVHTCIDNFDEDLVREAIERELARQGQVFFVHNRVQTIEAMAQIVQKLVPKARIGIGHGQMPDHVLEQVMTSFIRHESDILVCTTIIGSGIDIPNANTIIINNADRFGLAELYQLRGRVGRYKHRAFAYLLVPGDRVPSEDAMKRLKALEEFSTLGSGFRIAMRDLEIRGCGNILGGEQHGHIEAVGFDTYTQLVSEAVAEIKGEPIVRRVLPPFEVSVDAHIPEDYVPSESQKITLYKRIASLKALDEIDEMTQELTDRFGRPPGPVMRLLELMRARALAADLGITRVTASAESVVLDFASGHSLARPTRSALQQRLGQRVSFAWAQTPSMTVALGESQRDPVRAVIELLAWMGEL